MGAIENNRGQHVVTEQDIRFEFGENWQSFIDEHFDQSRVDVSRQHMLSFLGEESLSGKTFLFRRPAKQANEASSA